MAAINPNLILRRAATDRIARELRAGSIEGVGHFGTTGDLPGNPGPIDPPILTEGGVTLAPPPQQPTGGDYWTRFDPGYGQQTPTLSINPGEGGSSSSAGLPPASPGAIGPFPGGNMGGPQGSVYGRNPVTGNTIYNVTGSPRPGFLDSRTGKMATTLGSTALNIFVPGLGFVSKVIFDAVRNRSIAKNTGTDLSGRQRSTGGTSAGPPPSNNFTRGPGVGGSQGFQQMTPREYGQATFGGLTPTGYRDTSGSATYDRGAALLQQMAYQARPGNPNNMRPFAANGRFLMDAEGTPTMMGPLYPNPTRQGMYRGTQGGPAPYASNIDAYNRWQAAQPAYQKWKGG